MESNFYPNHRQTLIQSLCRSSLTHKAQLSVHEVFPHLKHTQTFHCTSFFRSEKKPAPRCNELEKFLIPDGRIYEVLEFKIIDSTTIDKPYPEEVCRCCYDVIETTSSQFVPMEVLFFETAFDGTWRDEQSRRDIVEHARLWVWKFLYLNHYTEDWSRSGLPFKGEVR